jgi:hypothetical protein
VRAVNGSRTRTPIKIIMSIEKSEMIEATDPKIPIERVETPTPKPHCNDWEPWASRKVAFLFSPFEIKVFATLLLIIPRKVRILLLIFILKIVFNIKDMAENRPRIAI